MKTPVVDTFDVADETVVDYIVDEIVVSGIPLDNISSSDVTHMMTAGISEYLYKTLGRETAIAFSLLLAMSQGSDQLTDDITDYRERLLSKFSEKLVEKGATFDEGSH